MIAILRNQQISKFAGCNKFSRVSSVELLEWWSIGLLQKEDIGVFPLLPCSSTPLLHDFFKLKAIVLNSLLGNIVAYFNHH